MTEDQIKHMVSRFLAWKLPENFNPDGGVNFERTYRGVGGVEYKCEPSGTNLFDYGQAEAMVRHMLDGLPSGDGQRLTECATHGCDRPATVRFERGGVGSNYCFACYSEVQKVVTPAA